MRSLGAGDGAGARLEVPGEELVERPVLVHWLLHLLQVHFVGLHIGRADQSASARVYMSHAMQCSLISVRSARQVHIWVLAVTRVEVSWWLLRMSSWQPRMPVDVTPGWQGHNAMSSQAANAQQPGSAPSRSSGYSWRCAACWLFMPTPVPCQHDSTSDPYSTCN
jgi:hypothetical protein